MERQRLMMDDFIRHQELKEIVLIDDTKETASLAGTLQTLSKHQSLYSTGNMTAHFRKGEVHDERDKSYLSQASLDNFLQVEENLGLMSKNSPSD